MSLAITGASGALGRATADLLLRTVDPREVVLTTRRPETLADLTARGAEARAADFGDPRTLATAFKGVDRMLLISTDAVGDRVEQHRAAITAAAEAGVGHIAYTSVPEPVPANPALVTSDHAETEQALRDSGVRWTMLRNNLYAHMQLAVIEQAAAAGRLVTNGGTGAAAYVTREDCAAAAVAVLTQEGHEDRAYDITGPEALTAAGLAALAGEVSGREIELVHVDDAASAAGLRAAGLPDEAAELVSSFGAATRGGYLARVTPAVADLTGHPPTALADLVRTTTKG